MSLSITIDINDLDKMKNLRNLLDLLIIENENNTDDNENENSFTEYKLFKEPEPEPSTTSSHITCDCGSKYKEIYQRKHFKSKRHIEYTSNKK